MEKPISETEARSELSAAQVIEAISHVTNGKSVDSTPPVIEGNPAPLEPVASAGLAIELRLANSRAEDLARQLADERARHARVISQLSRMKERLVTLNDKLETSSSRARSLSRQLTAEREDVRRQERALRRQRNEIERLRLEEQTNLFNKPRVRTWLTGLHTDWLWRLDSRQMAVACVGHGPFAKSSFDRQLTAAGWGVARVGSPEVAFLVTGREGWYEEEIHEHLDAQAGGDIYVLSQEMFLTMLATGDNPLLSADTRTLMEWAKGHPALQFLIKSGFKWPEVAETVRSALRLFEGKGESPIHKMGYSVGWSGLDTNERRQILKTAFRGSLPAIGRSPSDKAYLALWGAPGTPSRLRRMARHLWQQRNMREERDGYEVAVREWGSDLAWLKKNFYKPAMSFKWPSTRI